MTTCDLIPATRPGIPTARSGPASARAPISAAVVAASAVIRAGLTHVLSTVPGIVVRQSRTTIESLADGVPPQLLMIDLAGRDGNRFGDDLWSRVPAGSRVIALCRPDSPPDLLAAVHGGVHALLPQDCDAEEILLAVDAVRRGALHLSAELLDTTLRHSAVRSSRLRPELARREAEVLRWVADGLTHGQIGRRMGLTEATVNTYVKRIRSKLHAGNKAELTRRAIELGYADQR